MHNIMELQTVEHENLGDTVYRRLSEALMRGKFPPGTRLTIRELSSSLGTSVTPVRDAILRLIQDQALIQKTPREVRVPILTSERYCEIRDIRVRLEGLAVRRAAEKATTEDIAHLWSLVDQNEVALKEQRWQDALECNQLFHSFFAEIAQMPALASILATLWLQMGPLIAGVYEYGGRLMIDDHYAVMKAIEARDMEAAEAAIAKDITDASELILAGIDNLLHE
ncbi:GntR family transcriptional regulator [Falsochrobactrum sp. TDYN1]|uniref:GntR family transcriptional regulator n=1 Tax=Falsochrobactrum tianjinense TaxID=2706015 RepID=A0A949UT15_9HYPH|nr:GntR family transcriptional regulator [Falsochrobactrum sp. TDYN1]MBV2143489.1 GntR family transcriptional regulator [Falsochrobactrum sp. TDYN1]